MLRIRLARVGKKKQAQYRIVVADKRRAVQAKFVEILGWYNPYSKEINVDRNKAEEWMSKGAQPSNSLAVLFKKEKIKLPDWVKIKEKKKKPKKKPSSASKDFEVSEGQGEKEETKRQGKVEDNKEKAGQPTISTKGRWTSGPDQPKAEEVINDKKLEMGEKQEAGSTTQEKEESNSAPMSIGASLDKDEENKESKEKPEDKNK